MKQVKLTNQDIGSLCAAMHHLIHAGISAADALSMLAQDEPSSDYKKLLNEMSQRADGGLPLAEVFRDAGCFPSYVCDLLSVGHQVGKEEETLLALSQYYDNRAHMNQRLRTALLYPSVLVVVLLAVVIILLIYVLPIFNDVYAQLGSSLTGIAGGLLTFGTALRGIMPVLCVVLGAIVVFAVLTAAVSGLRAHLFYLWHKLRGDRGLSAMVNRARFAQSLSMALSSGMTALEAVCLASSLSDKTAEFSQRCNDCINYIEKGDSLVQALRETQLLAASECRLLEAGMRSGSGEIVMEQIAMRLLDDSQQAVESKVSRIEPALVVVMSLLVGVILLSVMLPLMHIMTAIA